MILKYFLAKANDSNLILLIFLNFCAFIFFSRMASPHSVFQYNPSANCCAFLSLIYTLVKQSQFIAVAELLIRFIMTAPPLW